jgi:hypothetical protein
VNGLKNLKRNNMTAVEFKNKIGSIIFAETPEMQSKLLKNLYKEVQQSEKMYSEEDLKEGFRSNYTPFSATNTGDFDEDFDRWFKQFKKK